MKVVFWGTYDTGKPRVRILIRGLKENGVHVTECHRNVWRGIEDKSQVRGLVSRIRIGVKWLSSYPRLICQFIKLEAHDAVIISYLGHLDVLILWPFAKLRGIPIIWDAFLSLHDTIVEDRHLVGRGHPFAMLIFIWEWLSCRAADLILLDTQAHANYFSEHFNLETRKVAALFVGAETDVFPPTETGKRTVDTGSQITVLFYGQFIPLHGIGTIIEAAREMEAEAVQWIIIGAGQEDANIRKRLDEIQLKNLRWLPWVDYTELVSWIQRADICLGIFGGSGKASRVIPNKVFQILSVGKPLITRDSSAIRELLNPDMEGIFLVEPEDPRALAESVRRFIKVRSKLSSKPLYRDIVWRITPKAIGVALVDCIRTLSGGET